MTYFHEWDLYHSSRHLRNDCHSATQALNAALGQAVAAVKSGMSREEAVRVHFEPVMAKWVHVGAWDTEPYTQAWERLEAETIPPLV